MEALLLHPQENEKILIGYARGLIVLWDRSATAACQTYVGTQQLEALSFRNDGSEFVSAHNDGSYVMWSTSRSEPLEPPNMPYGPYACKAITNVLWRHTTRYLLPRKFCYSRCVSSRIFYFSAIAGSSLVVECQGLAMETNSQ